VNWLLYDPVVLEIRAFGLPGVFAGHDIVVDRQREVPPDISPVGVEISGQLAVRFELRRGGETPWKPT